MADPEHLEILKQGVEAWNEWRTGNRRTKPDLIDVDLTLEDLVDADLGGADLGGADLRGAHLGYAKLNGANLSGVHLRGADLNGADLGGADLRGADLSRSNLFHTNLSKANLSKAILIGADLGSSDLSSANLNHANLLVANLSYANLSYANLSDADLSDADLSHSTIRGSDLSNGSMGCTILGDIDLSEVKGLETVRHNAPSIIGIDTLYKSAGKIPEVFLHGCGVPDDFITFIPSHFGIQQAVQFYSCFISYSTKDEGFARRLYSRMRDEKLRVWFAPEDIKGGEKLYEQIERAIQLHDRLLLVLSENSMQSEWVVTEIQRARETEVKENRRKLFPITIVDFNKVKAWKRFDADSGKDLAKEVREYFIPDFSNWKDHDAFEKAFDRLLRDLKAEEKKA